MTDPIATFASHPHVLEDIFLRRLALEDYASFDSCLRVSKTWERHLAPIEERLLGLGNNISDALLDAGKLRQFSLTEYRKTFLRHRRCVLPKMTIIP